MQEACPYTVPVNLRPKKDVTAPVARDKYQSEAEYIIVNKKGQITIGPKDYMKVERLYDETIYGQVTWIPGM